MERTPAGIGRRIGGIAIDWAASIAIAIVAFPQFSYGSSESGLATLMIFAGETMLFTWLITGSFGDTIVGVQILRVNGERLKLWQVAVRTILLCLVIPAVIMDSTGRGLHDKAVGSQAFRRPRRV